MAREKEYAIDVSAATLYLAEQSDEAAGRYVFAYTITLRNTGSVAALTAIAYSFSRAMHAL